MKFKGVLNSILERWHEIRVQVPEDKREELEPAMELIQEWNATGSTDYIKLKKEMKKLEILLDD